MKTYAFSIFVRGIIALSGFLVFIVSAKLFGAEGRGVMSYGTSLFASLSLFFSLNLGRTFVGKTNQNESLKKDLIFTFMLLNISAVIFSALLGLLFWTFSASAQSILPVNILLPLMLTSFYYVWNANGNAFFAAFLRNHQQEMIILFSRLMLAIFLLGLLYADSRDFSKFILLYSLILFFGILAEFILLVRIIGWRHQVPSWQQLKLTLKDTFWPQIDFLTFNLYPLLMILIAGHFLETSQIGRINFAIQIINLVFLFSTTANIRVNSYVSNFGFRTKLPQVKKLLLGTFSFSLMGSVVIYYVLTHFSKTALLKSFEGTESLFAITILALPGFMFYQLLNPLWLELRQIALLAKINFAIFISLILISPFVIQNFQEKGGVILFSLFHVAIFIAQIFLMRKNSLLNWS